MKQKKYKEWEDIRADVLYQMDKRQQENEQDKADRLEAICKVMALLLIAGLLGGITAVAHKWIQTHRVELRNPIVIEEVKQVNVLEPIIVEVKQK
jgi:preprotein translocase subunit YajC